MLLMTLEADISGEKENTNNTENEKGNIMFWRHCKYNKDVNQYGSLDEMDIFWEKYKAHSKTNTGRLR